MRCVAVLLVLSVPVLAVADTWPRFRGPNGDGHGAFDVPAKWTPQNIAWKVPIPGKGYSSPVVWEDRIFVTAGTESKRQILCLSTTSGKVLWTKEDAGKPYKMHRSNSPATATPALDAERVYAYWPAPGKSEIVAYSHAGMEVWRKPLSGYKSQHGGGASLVVHGNTVLIHHQPDGDGELVALSASTGTRRWSLPRTGGKNATYSAPCIRMGASGKAEAIVTNWQLGITGVDLESGKVVWSKSVFDTEDQQRCIPSPVLAGELVLGVCGFAGGARRLVALRPGERPAVEWKLESGVGQMATPLVVKDRVLVCNEEGVATWLDARSGKEIWKKRVGGTYRASPVLAGNRVYLAATDRKMWVIAAEDSYQLLATNDMGEGTQATPAICGGRMYVRTDGQLFCVAPERK